jgi:hypothetical protein
MGIVKGNWLNDYFSGSEVVGLKNPHLVVGDIGQKLSIVYHIHLIENTRFLEDLFWHSKRFRIERVKVYRYYGAVTDGFSGIPALR